MQLPLAELNESINLRGLTVHSMVCGEMVLAHLRRRVEFPIPDLANGLPDDVCRAEHWGYALRGSVVFEYLGRHRGARERGRGILLLTRSRLYL